MVDQPDEHDPSARPAQQQALRWAIGDLRRRLPPEDAPWQHSSQPRVVLQRDAECEETRGSGRGDASREVPKV